MEGKRFDQRKWYISFISAIHTLWKRQNLTKHGETDKEIEDITKMKYQKRIQELYKRSRKNLKRSRKNLSLNDKKLFNLLLQYHLKGAVCGLAIWIERAELVFQQQDQDEKNNLETKRWIFITTKK